jgi:hypothetical protein
VQIFNKFEVDSIEKLNLMDNEVETVFVGMMELKFVFALVEIACSVGKIIFILFRTCLALLLLDINHFL